MFRRLIRSLNAAADRRIQELLDGAAAAAIEQPAEDGVVDYFDTAVRPLLFPADPAGQPIPYQLTGLEPPRLRKRRRTCPSAMPYVGRNTW